MSEERKDYRWWEVLVKLTPLIIGLGVTGLGSYATFTLQAREHQLTKLKTLNEFRPLLESTKNTDRSFAYTAFVELGYESLAIKLAEAAKDPAGRPALSTIAETGSSNLRSSAEQALAAIPVYVFLQIAKEEQRTKAGEIGQAIASRGFMFEGVENVVKNGTAIPPVTTEVRYFNKSDSGAATSIAEVLRNTGVTDTRTVLLSLVKGKPGLVEVWFSKSQ